MWSNRLKDGRMVAGIVQTTDVNHALRRVRVMPPLRVTGRPIGRNCPFTHVVDAKTKDSEDPKTIALVDSDSVGSYTFITWSKYYQ